MSTGAAITCPFPYAPIGTSCYVVANLTNGQQPLAFDAASEFCRVASGGHLVKLNSGYEAELLRYAILGQGFDCENTPGHRKCGYTVEGRLRGSCGFR